MLTKATINDLAILDTIALKTISHMIKLKIPQWDLSYPRLKDFEIDILNNSLYIYKEHNKIIGFGVIMKENETAYKTLNNWLTDNSLVIHRIMTDPTHQNKGVAQAIINKAIEIGKKNNYKSIKIDTHLENYKMRRFLEKNNFIEIGYLKTINRIAYEKLLEDE